MKRELSNGMSKVVICTVKTVLEGRSPSYQNFFDTKAGSPDNSDFHVMFQGQELIIHISRYV